MIKKLILLGSLIATVRLTKTEASGTSIGNGIAPESIMKIASLEKSKTPDELCVDAGGKIEKSDGKTNTEDFCKLKDSKINMKDLINAATKNDSAKK